MKKYGKQSLEFEKTYILTTSTITGKIEKEGPITSYFDKSYNDNYCDEKSWEKAEMHLVMDSINIALRKAMLKECDIDLIISGDLNNQIVISNYVLKNYSFPYFGIYSACSTFTQGLIVGSTYIDNGYGENILVTSSSHNATSERQFRNPTEYGGQKSCTTTFTATAAAAALLTNKKTKIKITKATIGNIVDSTSLDQTDMGRIMAPAAVSTLKHHLEDFNIDTSYYDLIVTGDLSTYGKEMFLYLLDQKNIKIETNYEDCGLILYDVSKQPVFSGGSGAGCVSVVSMGYLYKEMLMGKFKKVLIIATGALLNPIMTFQKESIPAIAHAIALERVDI